MNDMKEQLISLLIKILSLCGHVFPSTLKSDTYVLMQTIIESKQ